MVARNEQCRKKRKINEEHEESRKKLKESVESIIQKFSRNVRKKTHFICNMCKLFRFEHQITLNIEGNFVCNYCKAYVFKNKMSPIDLNNNLKPKDLPDGLCKLNT